MKPHSTSGADQRNSSEIAGDICFALQGCFDKEKLRESRGVDLELPYCTNLQSAMYRESTVAPSVIQETSEDDQ
ncbi:hypothetical protein E2542_SST07882 [Spatholobus suberectus]|nr:hypothetical protein E2542_SST07882 [Spatholobus suberectus]